MITTAPPKGCILTYTGKFVNPLEATVDDIDILDIAHALSNLCRYNGHVSEFFSVAQHSVLVARHFEPKSYLRKWALLHDSSEAYLGDVVAPLKYSGHYDFYLDAEELLMGVIAEKFDLELPMPDEIDTVDKNLRGPEMRDLKNYMPQNLNGDTARIESCTPNFSEYLFLSEAKNLGIL